MKFYEDILNGFKVTGQTQFCDGHTDDRGKTICLSILKEWGDIITLITNQNRNNALDRSVLVGWLC